jgi:hypothetical protein
MERKSWVVAALVIALMFSLIAVPAVALEEVEWLCEQEGERSGAEIHEGVDTTFSEWREWAIRNPETGDTRCFPLTKNIGLPDDELVMCSCEFDRLDGAICLLGISADGSVCGGIILAKDCSNIKHATCTEMRTAAEETKTTTKSTPKTTDFRERYKDLLAETMPTAKPTATATPKPTAHRTVRLYTHTRF